jgi:hypothetical protein
MRRLGRLVKSVSPGPEKNNWGGGSKQHLLHGAKNGRSMKIDQRTDHSEPAVCKTNVLVEKKRRARKRQVLSYPDHKTLFEKQGRVLET